MAVVLFFSFHLKPLLSFFFFGRELSFSIDLRSEVASVAGDRDRDRAMFEWDRASSIYFLLRVLSELKWKTKTNKRRRLLKFRVAVSIADGAGR